jgi:hypothetical protein
MKSQERCGYNIAGRHFDPPLQGLNVLQVDHVFHLHNVATLCIRERIPSMKKTPMKAANERKTLMIKIRVNVGQLEMLQAAADRANLDLSTWIRTVALKAAKEW